MIRVVNIDPDIEANSQRIQNTIMGVTSRQRLEEIWVVFPIPRRHDPKYRQQIKNLLTLSFQAALSISAMLDNAIDIDRAIIAELISAMMEFEKAGYEAAKHIRKILQPFVTKVDLPFTVIEPNRLVVDMFYLDISAYDAMSSGRASCCYKVFLSNFAILITGEYSIRFEFLDSTLRSVRGSMIQVGSETDAILLSASLDVDNERKNVL